MRPSFNERDRRSLVIGAIAVVMIVLIGRVAPAYRRWQERSDLAARHALAAERRLVTLLRDRDRVARDVRVARSSRDSLDVELLDGDSPTAAAASLHEILKESAEAVGVSLGTVELRTDTASTLVFGRASARLALTGDARGVTQFLAALESGAPLIRVSGLAITAENPAAPPSEMEVLRAELTIEGLARRRVVGGATP